MRIVITALIIINTMIIVILIIIIIIIRNNNSNNNGNKSNVREKMKVAEEMYAMKHKGLVNVTEKLNQRLLDKAEKSK